MIDLVERLKWMVNLAVQIKSDQFLIDQDLAREIILSIESLQSRIVELEQALQEATEWNWLNDDMPTGIVDKIMKTLVGTPK